MRPPTRTFALCSVFLLAACESGPAEPENNVLTLARLGTGSGNVESTPSGIDCGDVCTAEYAVGTGVVLTAVADAGSVFDGWTGAGCGGDAACPITMSADATVVATFTSTPLLQVAPAGGGEGAVTSEPAGIDCGIDCTEAFRHGTEVTLEAVPETGSVFTGWSGGACSGTDPCVLDVDGDVTVTATFALLRYSLDVVLDGAASEDVVTSTPGGVVCTIPPKAGSGDPEPDCGEEFDYGTTVTLSTSTTPGFTALSGWSGGGCGQTTRCIFTITEPTTVTASYVPGSAVYDANVVEN